MKKLIEISPGEIAPTSMYSLTEAQRRSGLGKAAFRQARRKGLQVLYYGRVAFVKGSSLIKFIESHATNEKSGFETSQTSDTTND